MSDRKRYYSLLSGFVWLVVGTAFFAASALAETLLQEQGVLEQGDEVLPSDGSLADLYTFEGQAGQRIRITLESTEFNAYLILIDSELNKIGENDDANQGTQNAEIVLTLPTSGTYAVIVNGQNSNDRGRYSLTVSSGTASANTTSSATLLQDLPDGDYRYYDGPPLEAVNPSSSRPPLTQAIVLRKQGNTVVGIFFQYLDGNPCFKGIAL